MSLSWEIDLKPRSSYTKTYKWYDFRIKSLNRSANTEQIWKLGEPRGALKC